jgi:prepilin-type N-terminal cleavage/methylation domain-containing protein
MLSKFKKSNPEGFTIIEVLIVLAIAGLILLIVFLAVPALQRSARNTTRKSDASAVLSGLSEYTDNNNGTLPSTCTGTTTVTWGAAATAQSSTKVGYYNAGCVIAGPASSEVYLNTAGGTVAGLNGSAQDYIEVIEGDQCTAAGGAVAGSARETAILYEIETSAGYASQCEQS